MARPEIGISFRAEPNEGVLQRTARTVCKYPFDVISVYEDLGDQSPMYPLFTLVKHSRNARIGPACVAVPHYRTMLPVVGDIARLDSISPGNVYLGLAPGAWMGQVGKKSATVEQMREAANVSRYLLERKDEGFHGEYYQVKPGFTVNYPTPAGRVPLLIGAWGPNMAALAGEIADEIKAGGSANPRTVKIMKSRVEVGTERAGRNLQDVGIVLGAVTVVDQNRRKALEIARRRAAPYIAVIGEKDPTAMADFPVEIAAIREAMSRGDLEGAIGVLPDGLLKRFAFAGTPEDIIKQTGTIFDQGAARVEYGSPHGINPIQGIHLLGKEVLPYFEK